MAAKVCFSAWGGVCPSALEGCVKLPGGQDFCMHIQPPGYLWCCCSPAQLLLPSFLFSIWLPFTSLVPLARFQPFHMCTVWLLQLESASYPFQSGPPLSLLHGCLPALFPHQGPANPPHPSFPQLYDLVLSSSHKRPPAVLWAARAVLYHPWGSVLVLAGAKVLY